MLGIMDDSKKDVQAILDMPEEKDLSEDRPAESEHEMIAGRMMEALKSGNKKSFVSNLKSFITMCMNDDEYSESDGTEEMIEDEY